MRPIATPFRGEYPSGKPYTACGYPHPSGGDACSIPTDAIGSRPAGPHDGWHENRWGNEWADFDACSDCGHRAHSERGCDAWIDNGWTAHGCHCIHVED